MPKKNPTIGLMIPDIFDAYQKTILKGIIHQTKEMDIRLLSFIGGTLDHPDITYINRNPIYQMMDPMNIDILLLMTGALVTYTGLEGIQRMLPKYPDLPIISIAIEVPGIPSVLIDNTTGLYELITHLITDHGCKRIAFIKGPDKNDEARIRFETYKKCLVDHNIKYDAKLVCNGKFEPGDGEKGVKTLVDKRKVDFDAIIGVDDITAIDTYKPLLSRGYKLPHDIKIGGFDDIPKSLHCIPSLTTVRQPLFELGSIGVEMAIKHWQGKPVEMVKKIGTQLIIRESCGCSMLNVIDKSHHYNLGDIKNHSTREILESVKDFIEREYSAHTNTGYSTGYLNKTVLELIETIITAINTKNKKVLSKKITEILYDSYNKGYTGSLWASLLSIIFQRIKGALFKTSPDTFTDTLLYEALLSLNKTEIRVLTFKELHAEEVSQKLQRTGDALLTCFNNQKIKKILTDDLPVLGINNCIISLYTDSTKKKAKLFFYYGEKGSQRVTGKTFTPKYLFPKELEVPKHKSYIILGLVSETEQLGFILLELSDINETIYEYLSDKIAMSIKGADIMKQLQKYTIGLEKEVAKRTYELQLANKRLKDQSLKDQLSGLKNRRFLMEVIVPESNHLITSSEVIKKNKNKRLALNFAGFGLLLIDLDYFKQVNDTYGHKAGDMVLVQLSKIFEQNARKEDYVIRYGGEEFLLIFKNFNPSYLAVKAESIRKTVENFNFKISRGKIIKKTCSIGAVCFPVNINYANRINFMSAVNLADAALYYAKEHNRNKSIRISLTDNFFEENISLEKILATIDWAQQNNYIKMENTRHIVEKLRITENNRT